MSFETHKEGQFVDLTLNPERFTGYAGLSAAKVWKSIYEENCFGLSELSSSALPSGTANVLGLGGLGGIGGLSEGVGTEMRLSGLDGEECVEKRVYYRIISGQSISSSRPFPIRCGYLEWRHGLTFGFFPGLHASISTHICHEFLNQDTGLWVRPFQTVSKPIQLNTNRDQPLVFPSIPICPASSTESRPTPKDFRTCTSTPSSFSAPCPERESTSKRTTSARVYHCRTDWWKAKGRRPGMNGPKSG